jgi:hypothetical protein
MWALAPLRSLRCAPPPFRLINTLNRALRAPSRQSQVRCSSLHSHFLYAMKIFDKSLSVLGKAPQEQNVYLPESNSAARKTGEYSILPLYHR